MHQRQISWRGTERSLTAGAPSDHWRKGVVRAWAYAEQRARGGVARRQEERDLELLGAAWLWEGTEHEGGE